MSSLGAVIESSHWTLGRVTKTDAEGRGKHCRAYARLFPRKGSLVSATACGKARASQRLSLALHVASLLRLTHLCHKAASGEYAGYFFSVRFAWGGRVLS